MNEKITVTTIDSLSLKTDIVISDSKVFYHNSVVITAESIKDCIGILYEKNGVVEMHIKGGEVIPLADTDSEFNADEVAKKLLSACAKESLL